MEKNYNISLSNCQKGVFAVVGHVGVGHVHSHSSFVQDDSVGFAVVASFMREALDVDTHIKQIKGDPITGVIQVETRGGGIGEAFSRRGITPMEVELLSRAIDEDGIYTQGIAIKVFGRMYGQGVMETPVALQGAIALAILDSFCKKDPSKVYETTQPYQGRIDKMAGMVVNINGIEVSLLLNINGSQGGIGPDEDNEGNTAFGEKGELMKRLGMDVVPTIIVESKAYIPQMAHQIRESTFLFRAQEGVDNLLIANALMDASKEIKTPYLCLTDSLSQVKGELAKATGKFADDMILLAEQLKKVDRAMDKVTIIAEMAKLVSEDAGGISFMSNGLHEVVRSAGIVPGNAAIISMLVDTNYIDYWKIPLLNTKDIREFSWIIVLAINKLFEK